MANLDIRCTMVSVLALRQNDGQTEVLLLQRAGEYLHDVWSYIAGHIEDGETGWQAALRELKEETGLVSAGLYATSFCEQFYFAPKDCIMLVPAFVAHIDAEARVELNSEHAAYQWLPFDVALDTVPFGSQRDLFAHVKREFVERRPADVLRIKTD